MDYQDFLDNEYKRSLEDGYIDQELFDKLNVKRGLRNNNGTGVLVGLTKVSDVHGYTVKNEKKIPDDGHLYYRDVDIYDLAKIDKDAFGYERTCFLILFGHLPSEDELNDFKKIISDRYELPKDFLENIILRNVSSSVMNHLARAVLSLYSFDEDPDNTNPKEILRKGINIIAKLPAIVAYSVQSKSHYIDNDALHIHNPKPGYSIAQNLLYLSRNDGLFTELEAETLDLALTIHADHGGGNNSTFTNVVVSSTDTDIYSTIAAGICSLKGPRHGGANQKVLDMMYYIINDISLDATDEQMHDVVCKLLNKEYFDNSGLIYGIGHAVYTKSDPRCVLLKAKCKELSKQLGDETFSFYARFEAIAIAELEKRKGTNYCANVDYYSGLTYRLLNIPRDLFIPIFACARTVGWVAHIIENKLYCNKIIRPATAYVGKNVKEN
ncbi:MAG: citrate synthase [Acholeplasmatales bacterium]|nr:citrate synthase [Acholeplasmatales bacterium]